jgi:DNA-binding winged helix-turn-helix (wHTH) protein/tetratricopeptide (TPR) repeat protein
MNTSRTTSFDGWTLRADIGELAKDGRKIRLQQHPLLVLEELLARPGELVTREQLIARLWPKGIVEFDTGLNTAVRKLRVALEDTADVPRYIETIPRKGYRFIGTVDPPPAIGAPVRNAEAAPGYAHAPDMASPPAASPTRRRWTRPAIGAVIVLAVASIVAVFFGRDDTESSVAVTRPVLPEDNPIVVMSFGSAASGSDTTIAEIAGDLLRYRLARLPDALVIDATAMVRTSGDTATLRRLVTAHGRYIVNGTVDQQPDRIHVEVALHDASSGKTLATFADERAATDLAGAIDKLARDVACRLDLPADAIAAGRATAPVNTEAYAIFLESQRLLQTERVLDLQSAIELSRRATVLDPKFARAYVGLSQALQLAMYVLPMTDAEKDDASAEARAALDRAFALDPGMGEIFAERAGLTSDSEIADALYRESLQLAPSESAVHQRYAEFLFDEYRRGEALEEMERAVLLDPLDPRLHQRLALFHFFVNSDVAAHDRLMAEALAINPKMASALFQLGTSKHVYSGQFAEGIRLLERAIALDPASDEWKVRIATLYLDVDDPAAALAILKQCEGEPRALVEVAQYQSQRQRAAELARRVPIEEWRTMWSVPEAAALRDAAIASGDFSTALEVIGKRFPMTVETGTQKPGRPRIGNRALNLLYAHTLVSAGEIQRGRKLAGEIVAQLDGESLGRPKFFFSRDRATAFAILGDKDRALAELQNSLEVGHYYMWWYLADHDPLFEGFRSDPRFQALVARAKAHRVQQRALLDEMRRKGEVPTR